MQGKVILISNHTVLPIFVIFLLNVHQTAQSLISSKIPISNQDEGISVNNKENPKAISDNNSEPLPSSSSSKILANHREGHYSLSSTYMPYLAKLENNIYTNMKNYVKHLKESLDIAEAYINDYEESTITQDPKASLNDKTEEIAANPLMAYRMIRRFAKEFKTFVGHLEKDLSRALLNHIKKLGGLTGFPQEKDYNEAADVLLNLQFYYNLSSSHIAAGKINGVKTTAKLSPGQCKEITEYALSKKQYYLAKEWLQTTRTEYKKYGTDVSTTRKEFEIIQNQIVKNHDTDFGKNSELDNYTFSYSFSEKLSINPNAIPLRQVIYEKYIKAPRNDDSCHYHFLALCNGVDMLTPKQKSKLHCWLDTKINPYFRIFPLKMELHSVDPYVVQIYDIVSDDWIRHIRESGTPMLERPPSSSPGELRRTATYAWLLDQEIPNASLSRRIELISGLKVAGPNASDFLQLGSYPIGGHVMTHVDYLYIDSHNPVDEDVKFKGDRLATFLVYLNDVPMGGATAFPILGIFVKPVKGSAVLWYSTRRNGEIDYRTIHGACPVIFGAKWIATKWVHQYDNFLTRKCDKDPKA